MSSQTLVRLFMLAFLARMILGVAFDVTGLLEGGISRDSLKYHQRAIEIAYLYEIGQIDWGKWIDHAWYEFTGVIYWIFGPQPTVIQFFNAVCGGLAAVYTAKLGYAVFQHRQVAAFAGVLVAIFPSFVFFSSLLLKDALSLLLAIMLCYSAVKVRQGGSGKYVCLMGLSLLMYLGIREYFFFAGAAMWFVCLLPIWGQQVVSGKGLVAGVLCFGILSWVLGFGFMGIDYLLSLEYFDLEYINEIRGKLSRGSGAIRGEAWGDGLFSDVFNILTAAYFALFSVNIFDIASARQLLAVPEFLFVLIAVWPMVVGIRIAWRHYRSAAIPLIVFGIGVLALYSSATTNAGALFRWRMQAMPFLFILLAVGLVYLPRNPLRSLLVKTGQLVGVAPVKPREDYASDN